MRALKGNKIGLAVLAASVVVLTPLAAPITAPPIIFAASNGTERVPWAAVAMAQSGDVLGFCAAYAQKLAEGPHAYVLPVTAAVIAAAVGLVVLYEQLCNPSRDVQGGVLGDERIIATRSGRARGNVCWDGRGSAPGPSLVYGYEAGKMIGDPEFAHGFVAAKSGSGKSRSIGYPSLYWNVMAGASVVYTARKATDYMLTYEAVEGAGYEAILLDLQQPKRGARFNLMDTVNARAAAKDVAGAQRASRQIAADFIQHDEKNPYFSNAARALLAAAVLIVALSEEAEDSERNMISVARVVRVGMTGDGKDPGAPLKDYIRSLGTEHPVYKTAEEFLQDKGSTAAQNVASTLMTGITILGDEGIEWMLSGSDFTLRELLEEKCVLYPHVMGEGDPYNAVLTALYNQLWEAAQEVSEENGGKLPHPFVILGDEWGNVPRVGCLGEMVSLGEVHGLPRVPVRPEHGAAQQVQRLRRRRSWRGQAAREYEPPDCHERYEDAPRRGVLQRAVRQEDSAHEVQLSEPVGRVDGPDERQRVDGRAPGGPRARLLVQRPRSQPRRHRRREGRGERRPGPRGHLRDACSGRHAHKARGRLLWLGH